ncbi:MAG: amidohydrolase [Clostridia bacterium]|nr:amidohydrolase [Clostridia bacterium]
MLDTIIRIRRALHQIPELGYELEKTQKYVIDELKKTTAKLDIAAPSGVIAFFDFGKEESIAFRADMDALPMEEKSGVPFASCHTGKMHACGHDGHMAILLSFAHVLSNRKTASNKNAVLVFQPAEEAGNGAKKMLETDFMEKYNVTEIYALHVEPSIPKGTIAAKSGAFMARSCEIHVFGYGKSAHIAKAHEGIDALEMSARFYLRAMDEIEAKYKTEPHLFKFGRFVSGNANNVLSPLTQIDGSLRAFDDEVFKNMKNDIQKIADETAKAYGGRIEAVTDEGYPPVINSASCYTRLKKASKGLPFTELKAPYMTAEDFSCYLKHAPGLMFNIGIGTETELHSNAFRFDEDGLVNGLKAFIGLFDEA